MNKTLRIDGFEDRVQLAVGTWMANGHTIKELGTQMGISRSHLHPMNQWGSGKVARFCAVTGESADWLLGLRSNRYDR